MNQPKVTLYSKPDCGPCATAKRLMNRKGIDYTIIDVTKDEGAFKYIKSLGYQAVPVTVVDTTTQPVHWHGANPNIINMHFPADA